MNSTSTNGSKENLIDDRVQTSSIRIFLLILLCLAVIIGCLGTSIYFTHYCWTTNFNDLHCLSVNTLRNYSINKNLTHSNSQESIPFIFKKSAVASDMYQCSIVGKDMLKFGGSAVDAAIAVSFCLGTMNIHSSGIGGGGAMLVFDPKLVSSDPTIFGGFSFYDYREIAGSLTNLSQYIGNVDSTRKGGLSIAVPGEIAGLYQAWQKHGLLPWSMLVEPSYQMAKNGFPLHQRLYEAAKTMLTVIIKDDGLRSLLIEGEDVLPLGSMIINKELAETLKSISIDPIGFYNGYLSKKIMEDLQLIGANIVASDLHNYRVEKKQPLVLEIGNKMLYSAPLPFGGACVLNIVNVLHEFYKNTPNGTNPCDNMSLFIHRLVESFKFAFSDRSKMADPNFISIPKLNELLNNMLNSTKAKERKLKIDDNSTHSVQYYEPLFDINNDHGTTHASIIDSLGRAVSVTSSINEWFGSVFRSVKTGIIYNNQIDDFSIPNRFNGFGLLASPLNRPEPGKRPQSSISPTIIITKDLVTKVKKPDFIVGASGGSRIITSTASVISYHLFCRDDVKDSISKPRVHHQLSPNEIIVERGTPINSSIIKDLKTKGHRIELTYRHEFSAVQGVQIENTLGVDIIKAWSDRRKYGQADGF